MVELRFRYGDAVVRRRERAGDPDDAAAPARRVPARRGARARGGGARGREAIELGEHVSRSTASASRPTSIVGADGANGTTARARRARRRDRPRRRVRGERPVRVVSPRAVRAPRACVELADIPGGYGWVFPKGDHVERRRRRAGRARGRSSASTCARVCEAHGLDADDAREPARPPAAAAAARARAIAGERALLVGDAAGLIDPVSGDGMYECFVSVAARRRGDPRPARRPRSTLEPYEAGGRRRARAAPPRLVEAEAGARPLAARLVAGRAHEAPLAQRRAAAARRAGGSGGAARPRPDPACGRWTSWAEPKADSVSVPTKDRAWISNPLLKHAVELGASDIHLKLGRPPVIRRDGEIIALDMPPLTDEDLDDDPAHGHCRARRSATTSSTRAATSTSPTRRRGCRASASTRFASAARRRSRSA